MTTQRPPSPRSTLRTALAVLVTGLLAVLATALVPGVAAAHPGGPVAAPVLFPAAPGSPNGWVRLGHLSPKTPPVDIYLSPFGQPQRVAFREAAYGAVTPYTPLAPGAYTVSMRLAGAAASSPPALSANVDVKPNVAATALVFQNGPNGTIKPTLLTDDLSTPPAGDGKVRIVQGSPELTDVSVAADNGPSLASGLKYGDISPYTPVPAGHWNLAVKGGTQTIAAATDVRDSRAATLVVVDKPGGGVTVTQLPDSTGTATAPAGGAETGAGGTAPGSLPVLALLGVAATVGAVTVAVGRRRGTRRGARHGAA